MLIAIDTETELITPEEQAPRIVCLQVATADGATIYHWSEAEPIFRDLLRSGHTLTGAHIAYDMCCAMRLWPHLALDIFNAYEGDRIEDLQINAKLWDIARGEYPAKSYSLGACAKRFAGIRLDKSDPWRLRYGELRDTAVEYWPEAAKSYALADAIATYQTTVAIDAVAGEIILADRYRQARASFALKLTANQGLLKDPLAVNEFEASLLHSAEAERATLLEHGLLRQEKNRLVRCVKRVQARAAQLPGQTTLTTKGRPSTAKDVLADCGDPILESYSRYNSIQKQLTTDIPLLRGKGDRVHTWFEVLKETGRTGSDHPNVQNLARLSGIRECFIAPPGYVLAMGDYGKGELCTWSQVCLWVLGRSRMADVLNAGGDPHLEVAAMIRNVSYAEALTRKKEFNEERQAGKVANFGLPGGMGIDRFVQYAKKQYGVILTREMAQNVKVHWLAAWEGREYFAWINSLLRGADSTTITQFVSLRQRGNVGYCDCANGFFQALLADAAKHAGFYLARACYAEPSSPLYGSHLVNFVHDEWIAEVLEDRAHWAVTELARIMHERAADFIPNVTPQVDPILTRRWSKKAEPVWSNGQLVPWG